MLSLFRKRSKDDRSEFIALIHKQANIAGKRYEPNRRCPPHKPFHKGCGWLCTGATIYLFEQLESLVTIPNRPAILDSNLFEWYLTDLGENRSKDLVFDVQQAAERLYEQGARLIK